MNHFNFTALITVLFSEPITKYPKIKIHKKYFRFCLAPVVAVTRDLSVGPVNDVGPVVDGSEHIPDGGALALRRPTSLNLQSLMSSFLFKEQLSHFNIKNINHFVHCRATIDRRIYCWYEGALAFER